jgi:DNA-binding HxlR family transcriptional regulator
VPVNLQQANKRYNDMYVRKLPVDLDCPLRLTMSLIDSKWKSCILDELRNSSLRPSELHRALPEATPRVLDIQLKELVDDGLVSKTIYPELPPRSEYTITDLGRSLLPILDAMIHWGEENYDLFEKKYGRSEKNKLNK